MSGFSEVFFALKRIVPILFIIISVLFTSCANDVPDFKLTGEQTVHGISYSPLLDNVEESTYIYGKCTSCTVKSMTDDMFSLYLSTKYNNETFDVRVGIGQGRSNSIDIGKIKGKTFVAYGSVLDHISDSGRRIFQPIYIELDGEIYNTTEFIDHLAK